MGKMGSCCGGGTDRNDESKVKESIDKVDQILEEIKQSKNKHR